MGATNWVGWRRGWGHGAIGGHGTRSHGSMGVEGGRVEWGKGGASGAGGAGGHALGPFKVI